MNSWMCIITEHAGRTVKASKVLGVLVCVVGVAVAESPGPDRAGSLEQIVGLGLEDVTREALPVRAVAVTVAVPERGKLWPVAGVAVDAPGWVRLPGKAQALGTDFLPSFGAVEDVGAGVGLENVRPVGLMEVEVSWLLMEGVSVPVLDVGSGVVGFGVAAVPPQRPARSIGVEWHLVPFQVGRHTPMGELKVAADAALARGDAEEAERLQREYWRIGGITVSRREVFSNRSAGLRGGSGND